VEFGRREDFLLKKMPDKKIGDGINFPSPTFKTFFNQSKYIYCLIIFD
jgi:hypothetical protein